MRVSASQPSLGPPRPGTSLSSSGSRPATVVGHRTGPALATSEALHFGLVPRDSIIFQRSPSVQRLPTPNKPPPWSQTQPAGGQLFDDPRWQQPWQDDDAPHGRASTREGRRGAHQDRTWASSEASDYLRSGTASPGEGFAEEPPSSPSYERMPPDRPMSSAAMMAMAAAARFEESQKLKARDAALAARRSSPAQAARGSRPIWHTANYTPPRGKQEAQMSAAAQQKLLEKKGPPSADELLQILQIANTRLPKTRRGGFSTLGMPSPRRGRDRRSRGVDMVSFATMDETQLA